ncbi:DNA-binding response regulator [Psychromonas sp. psych-6C06]|uniref:response regulator transcription factor n=1 Tax=Psychromonas sp. psych-6C06 TaxID=2058089 RepID=UPI000C33C902|nr:response regulator transcription factor [Psychromonas sp. psych-6C06]PKF63312.1 DNA-binding response regulator [Psychromonas sp. psych-6C06]
MFHIAILGDNLPRCELLTKVLKKARYRVTCLQEETQLSNTLTHLNADLVLMEYSNPNNDLLKLISDISQSFAIPILLLTSSEHQQYAIEGLRSGADQYLIKPHSNSTLLVFIEVLLRRVALEQQRAAFQHCSQQFSLKIARLPLTETEQSLVQYLSKSAGDIISKMTLQKEVLKKELCPFDRNLDVHISNIRRKMQGAGLSKQHIKTVHGQGYRFSEQLL